jgi:type II secretory pathway component GspD/PulD (secretin)
VADTTEHIAAVKQLLKQIDIPLKQVLIEARIVNVDEAFAHALGLELNGYAGFISNKDKSKLKRMLYHLGNITLLLLNLATTTCLIYG